MNWNSKIPYYFQVETKKTVVMTLFVLACLAVMISGLLGHLQMITGLNASSQVFMMTLGSMFALATSYFFYTHAKKHPVYLHKLLQNKAPVVTIKNFIREMNGGINILVNGKTALHIAASQARSLVIRALCLKDDRILNSRHLYNELNKNRNIDLHRLNIHNLRPIDEAIKSGSLTAIEELKKCGLSLDSQEEGRLAPLYKAVEANDGQAVSLLIQAGADPISYGNYYRGQYPLDSYSDALSHAIKKNKVNAFDAILANYPLSKSQIKELYLQVQEQINKHLGTTSIALLKSLHKNLPKDYFNQKEQILCILKNIKFRSFEENEHVELLKEILSEVTYPFILNYEGKEVEAYFPAFVRADYRERYYLGILKVFVTSGKFRLLEERDSNKVSAMEYALVHRDQNTVTVLEEARIPFDALALQEVRRILVDLEACNLDDLRSISCAKKELRQIYINNPYLRAICVTHGFSRIDVDTPVPPHPTLKNKDYIRLDRYFSTFEERAWIELARRIYNDFPILPLDLWNIISHYVSFVDPPPRKDLVPASSGSS